MRWLEWGIAGRQSVVTLELPPTVRWPLVKVGMDMVRDRGKERKEKRRNGEEEEKGGKSQKGEQAARRGNREEEEKGSNWKKKWKRRREIGKRGGGW